MLRLTLPLRKVKCDSRGVQEAWTEKPGCRCNAGTRESLQMGCLWGFGEPSVGAGRTQRAETGGWMLEGGSNKVLPAHKATGCAGETKRTAGSRSLRRGERGEVKSGTVSAAGRVRDDATSFLKRVNRTGEKRKADQESKT